MVLISYKVIYDLNITSIKEQECVNVKRNVYKIGTTIFILKFLCFTHLRTTENVHGKKASSNPGYPSI
jgi:hypothetical protein